MAQAAAAAAALFPDVVLPKPVVTMPSNGSVLRTGSPRSPRGAHSPRRSAIDATNWPASSPRNLASGVGAGYPQKTRADDRAGSPRGPKLPGGDASVLKGSPNGAKNALAAVAPKSTVLKNTVAALPQKSNGGDPNARAGSPKGPKNGSASLPQKTAGGDCNACAGSPKASTKSVAASLPQKAAGGDASPKGPKNGPVALPQKSTVGDANARTGSPKGPKSSSTSLTQKAASGDVTARAGSPKGPKSVPAAQPLKNGGGDATGRMGSPRGTKVTDAPPQPSRKSSGYDGASAPAAAKRVAGSPRRSGSGAAAKNKM